MRGTWPFTPLFLLDAKRYGGLQLPSTASANDSQPLQRQGSRSLAQKWSEAQVGSRQSCFGITSLSYKPPTTAPTINIVRIV